VRRKHPPTFVSCGMGVQSAAIIALICRRRLRRPDGIFFCDCGGEFRWTYKYADYITRKARGYGVEITTLKTGNILKDGLDGTDDFLYLPAHRLKDGKKQLLRRSCTSHYKVEPIIQEIRRRLGLEKGAWWKRLAIQWMGISWEERHRRKQPKTKWIRNEYPLCKLRMTRQDCKNYLADNGFEIPGRSMCTICPYHSNNTWKAMRDHGAADWKTAVSFDKAIRHRGPGRTHPIFLHRSCVPLDEANIERGWSRSMKHGNR
jgi:3'-phosphoadenosine 5'-phosphosulfate sulfotransferase (PAPS reductase)/FAD synthetase